MLYGTAESRALSKPIQTAPLPVNRRQPSLTTIRRLRLHSVSTIDAPRSRAFLHHPTRCNYESAISGLAATLRHLACTVPRISLADFHRREDWTSPCSINAQTPPARRPSFLFDKASCFWRKLFLLTSDRFSTATGVSFAGGNISGFAMTARLNSRYVSTPTSAC